MKGMISYNECEGLDALLTSTTSIYTLSLGISFPKMDCWNIKSFESYVCSHTFKQNNQLSDQ